MGLCAKAWCHYSAKPEFEGFCSEECRSYPVTRQTPFPAVQKVLSPPYPTSRIPASIQQKPAEALCLNDCPNTGVPEVEACCSDACFREYVDRLMESVRPKEGRAEVRFSKEYFRHLLRIPSGLQIDHIEIDRISNCVRVIAQGPGIKPQLPGNHPYLYSSIEELKKDIQL